MNKYAEVPTAFPWSHEDVTCTGMTLRDYFAAQAMQSAYFHFTNDENGHTKHWTIEGLAESVYAMADAMLAARQA